MTNLPQSWQLQLGKRYSLRGWIEYGFKQVKNELGWADFRVTDYASIERWWEVVLSAYLLITWHANDFPHQAPSQTAQPPINSTSTMPFAHHTSWELGTTSEECFEQFTLAHSAVDLLVFAGALVTGFSDSWLSAVLLQTDGLSE